MEKENKITFRIGGESGQGQQLAGLVLGRVCLLSGLFCFVSSRFSSRLRGGLAVNQVSISDKPVSSELKQADVFFALSQLAMEDCQKDAIDNSLIFYDVNKVKEISKNERRIKYIPLSFSELISKDNLDRSVFNFLILGISAFLFNLDINLLKKETVKALDHNGKDLVNKNIRAVEIGWEYADKEIKFKKFTHKVKKTSGLKRILLTGNEAVVDGAISANCKFYSSYPMTPASSILHILAKLANKFKIIVNHSEDEIAAINMAIGASWAGVRSMVGTSGGGFALMNEGLGLAAMSETPLVIVESQRPGPSTGMATWTEQGDLQYLAKAGNGEFPRIILAPTDAEESFYFTILAFNLADIYQIPVFILLDKYISESHQVVSKFKIDNIEINRGKIISNSQLAKTKDYKRYSLTEDGVSSRSFPGQKNGIFLANGNEHDQHGFNIDGFTKSDREEQMQKRQIKTKSILKDLLKPELFGPINAKLTLVGWGSTKGIVLEALKTLNKNSNRVNYVHIPAPFPINAKVLSELLENKKVVVIENNYTGQMANLMQEALGQKFENRLNKYDGRQFFPEEIIQKIKKYEK